MHFPVAYYLLTVFLDVTLRLNKNKIILNHNLIRINYFETVSRYPRLCWISSNKRKSSHNLKRTFRVLVWMKNYLSNRILVACESLNEETCNNAWPCWFVQLVITESSLFSFPVCYHWDRTVSTLCMNHRY